MYFRFIVDVSVNDVGDSQEVMRTIYQMMSTNCYNNNSNEPVGLYKYLGKKPTITIDV